MTRCPACAQPNPDVAVFCMHCGGPLQRRPAAPFLTLADLWAPAAAKEAGLLTVAVFLLRSALHPLLRVKAGLRDEAGVAAFHLALALACGLGLAFLRRARDGRQGWVYWGVFAVAGGITSFSLDYFYNYQRLVYRALWTLLEFFYPDPGMASGERAYGILQVLRLAGPAFFLWAGYALKVRRPGLWVAGAAWALAALWLRYFLHGAGLSAYDLALGPIFIYMTSVFFVLYGLGPRPEEGRLPAQAP